jgi:hypothetical protein
VSLSICQSDRVDVETEAAAHGAPFCSNWRDLFLCSLVKHAFKHEFKCVFLRSYTELDYVPLSHAVHKISQTKKELQIIIYGSAKCIFDGAALLSMARTPKNLIIMFQQANNAKS